MGFWKLLVRWNEDTTERFEESIPTMLQLCLGKKNPKLLMLIALYLKNGDRKMLEDSSIEECRILPFAEVCFQSRLLRKKMASLMQKCGVSETYM